MPQSGRAVDKHLLYRAANKMLHVSETLVLLLTKPCNTAEHTPKSEILSKLNMTFRMA